MVALDSIAFTQELSDSRPVTMGEHQSTPAAVAAPIHADWPTLGELSRRYVERVLSTTEGNQTRAALVLGVDRRTVRRISRTTMSTPAGSRG